MSGTATHLSLRLNATEQAKFEAVRKHLEQVTGTRLSVADVFRMGVRALAHAHDVKGGK